ncbi:MAG TPA: ACT domain-containing protein [Magnetospirillaceae bacterium]|nr:ACT domain-containing protein [Magnetospirillaceae bacterium]
MSKVYILVSALGADRVGIVDDLSGIVADAGGNIEESKMAVLGGEFAVMMLVAADEPAAAVLESRMGDAESSLGLRIAVKRTFEASKPEGGRPYSLETVSLDSRGIVHAVSAVLRRRGINIEELETRTERAPLTGAPLFHMKAQIVIGPRQSAAALRRELEELHTGQDLDVALTPLVPSRMD